MSGLPGWSTRDPLKLCPCIRSKYLSLYECAKAQGIELVTIETARDLARQRAYKAAGTSRTLLSKHLPQPPNGLALAFDVVPKHYLRLKGWNPSGPIWGKLGLMGEALGLTWGGSWRTFVDKPHFQLDKCECPKVCP